MVFAQGKVQSLPSAQTKPAAELSVKDAVILGLIEGITEFLPISSTGHLIITTHALKLESQEPLHGADGQPLWYKRPSRKNPAGEPLTLKLAADTYTVVIQFGAIAAVALLYWRQFVAMFLGLLGRDAAGRRLLVNLVIAFIPAALIGLLAHHWIDQHLFSIGTVIAAQVAGAGLMLYAEYWRRRAACRGRQVRELIDLSARSSANIGLLQCLALWPGMSRSMTVIVGGYFAGLEARRAAEFSFLLGFVTLSAATILKSYSSGGAMIAVFGWSNVLLGCIVAAVSAAVAVRFLVGFITRHGLTVFAIYRLITAAALAVWLFV